MSWIKVILDERICEMTTLSDAIFESEDKELIDTWQALSGLSSDYDYEALVEVCTNESYEEIIMNGKKILAKVESSNI